MVTSRPTAASTVAPPTSCRVPSGSPSSAVASNGDRTGTLGHLLVNWAHPYAPAMISSLMLLGVPVLSPLLATALLGEPLGALQLVGGAAVLAAVGRLVTMPPRTDLAEGVAETDAP